MFTFTKKFSPFDGDATKGKVWRGWLLCYFGDFFHWPEFWLLCESLPNKASEQPGEHDVTYLSWRVWATRNILYVASFSSPPPPPIQQVSIRHGGRELLALLCAHSWWSNRSAEQDSHHYQRELPRVRRNSHMYTPKDTRSLRNER